MKMKRITLLLLYSLGLGFFPFSACQKQFKAKYKPGTRRVVKGMEAHKMHQVYIPPGRFTMGSPESEKGRRKNEGPQTKVTLTQGFWMLETEVTEAQYSAIMGKRGKDEPSLDLYRCSEQKTRCPIVVVSWHEAAHFANLLYKKEKKPTCFTCRPSPDKKMKVFCKVEKDYLSCKGWRLPTEAEWEYAARSGTRASRYGKLDAIAWFANNSKGKRHPVAQKKTNHWGLYDMLGNVSEWCADDWSDSLPGGSVTNPLFREKKATSRIERGGEMSSYPSKVRAAARGRYGFRRHSLGLVLRNYGIGFRLVRTD